MSTPINPDQNGAGAQAPQQGYAPAPQRHQAQPAFGVPPQQARQQGAPTGGFVPGQGAVSALNSAAPTHARLPQRLGDDGKTTPIGFGRLVGVELRKQVDTRAGRWLMGVTAALIIVASALVAYTDRDHVSFSNLINAALIPMNYLVPILGIMAVTSEWSQRTGLVTFTLEPRRSRVALAKLVATLMLAAVATVLALLSAAFFTLVMGSIGSGDADWHLESIAWLTLFVYMLIQAGMGVGFGMLLQNTPGAICAFLFIPILISFLNIVSWGRTLAQWINPGQALAPLVDGSMSGNDWGRIAVCTFVWMVLPLVLGFVRLNQREVKSS